MKTNTQKANAEYRRARIRAEKTGKATDDYRRLRAQRQMERAVIAILQESHGKEER